MTTQAALLPAAALSTMASDTATTPSRTARYAGRALSGIAFVFLAFDAMVKVLYLPPAVEGTTQLGYSASIIVPLGVLQLVMLALYAVPRTAIFGAILWTGYLGGAVATHVRLGNPVATHLLSPVYVAVFLWLGLWLRNETLRALVPWARPVAKRAVAR